MKDILSLSCSLGLIAVVCTSLLAKVDEVTKAPIRQTEQAALNEKLNEVLPSYSTLDDKVEVAEDGQKFDLYIARDAAGETVGYAMQGTTSKGFGGDIVMLVGYDIDLNITRAVTMAHKETPGLGTIVTDRQDVKVLWDLFAEPKAAAEEPASTSFIDQYTGKNAEVSLKMTKDGGTIDAVSGATVSTVASLDAVNKISEALFIYLDEKGLL